MKVQPSVKKRGSGFFTRRKGRLYFIDKKRPKNKQRQG